MELLDRSALPPFFLRALGQRPFRAGRNLDRGQMALSADGDTLWYAEGVGLAEVSTRDGLVRKVVQPMSTRVFNRVARTADDQLLLVGYSDAVWFDPRREVVLGGVELEHGKQWIVAASPTEPDRGACVAAYATECGYVFDRVEGARRLDIEKRAGTTRAALFTPDGTSLLVLCDRAVLRFDARSGQTLPPLYTDAHHVARGEAPLETLTALTFLDVNTALVVDYRGRAIALDMVSGQLRMSTTLQHGYVVARGDGLGGPLIVARDGAVDVYDAGSLAHLATMPGDIVFSLDGDVLLDPARAVAWVVDYRGAVHSVDVRARALHTVPVANFPSALEWKGDAILVGRFMSPVERVDVTTGASTFVPLAPLAHPVAFSEDGASVFVRVSDVGNFVSLRDGSAGPSVPARGYFAVRAGRCWSLTSRELSDGTRTLPLDGLKSVRSLAVSPSGERVLLVGRSELRLADAQEGAVVGRSKFLGVRYAHMITEDEALLLGARGVHWIDARTGAVLVHAKHVYGDRVVVSPDGGTALVLGGMDSPTLVTRDRPDAPVRFRGVRFPSAGAFSSDGTQVAVAGAESVVRLFDVAAALATRPPPKGAKKAKATAKTKAVATKSTNVVDE